MKIKIDSVVPKWDDWINVVKPVQGKYDFSTLNSGKSYAVVNNYIK